MEAHEDDDEEEIKTDPTDGLPASKAGEWAERKHALLRAYVDISAPTRRKYLPGGPGSEFKGGAGYIELFSGSARSFKTGTDDFIDGSPLVAIAEAQRTNSMFNALHFGDKNAEFCQALDARLRARGIVAKTYPKAAAEAAAEIVANLDKYALNFAFVDPYGIRQLPFTIIETLARAKRMDVLMHVSASALQRNLERWMASTACPLDKFAPGWREKVRGRKPDIQARGLILEHWTGLIQSVGFKTAKSRPLIRGTQRNQALYWLVLVAKHDLAVKFWDRVNKIEGDLFAES